MPNPRLEESWFEKVCKEEREPWKTLENSTVQGPNARHESFNIGTHTHTHADSFRGLNPKGSLWRRKQYLDPGQSHFFATHVNAASIKQNDYKIMTNQGHLTNLHGQLALLSFSHTFGSRSLVLVGQPRPMVSCHHVRNVHIAPFLLGQRTSSVLPQSAVSRACLLSPRMEEPLCFSSGKVTCSVTFLYWA